MQMKQSLRAEFCRSRATEAGSGIFWIMMELTNFLIWRDLLGKPQPTANYKGKQGVQGVGALNAQLQITQLLLLLFEILVLPRIS